MKEGLKNRMKHTVIGTMVIAIIGILTWAHSSEPNIYAFGAGYRVPRIIVSTNELNFGKVKIGDSAHLGFSIHNFGETGSYLIVRSLSISGDGFQIIDSPGIPFMVPLGTHRDVIVRFRPTSIGKFFGTITIKAEVQKDVKISLFGEAEVQPQGRLP